MKKLLTAVIAIIMGGFMVTAPVFAECTKAQKDQGCVSTAIIGNGCSCDDGTGNSVTHVLELALDIFTGVLGIVAVIGITIVGIQYLTAGGSEEKTRKSKRRLFEIVLGIAVYVAIYVLLKWLLPYWK